MKYVYAEKVNLKIRVVIKLFVDKDGKIIRYENMSDEHEAIKIIEKRVKVGNIGLIVRGDENSQMLMFEANRFYDKVDLKDKSIKIIYQTKTGTFVDSAVNIAFNENLIRFNWVIPSNATTNVGTIIACIQFLGEHENGNRYSLKTTNFSLKIEDSLEGIDINVDVSKNWFTDIESRLHKLETSSSSSNNLFIGTEEEFNAELAKGNIKEGQIIYLID